MIHILSQPVNAVNSAILTEGDNVPSSQISNKIRITKRNGEFLELDQRRVQIRENQNGVMALSYKAPLFETAELEDFFNNLNSSDKLDFDIGETGGFGVNFRGIIEGKDKNFSQNLDHKILLLEEQKCFVKEEIRFVKRYSKFVPRGKISE